MNSATRSLSPHFSPPFVAKRFKGAACLAFATEERASIVDTMLSTPTTHMDVGSAENAGAIFCQSKSQTGRAIGPLHAYMDVGARAMQEQLPRRRVVRNAG